MPIAATRSGKIEGLELDGVLVFRGIPYAAPPVGPRRFRPPVREEAWDGVRDATQFGPHSAQGDIPLARLLGGNGADSREDGLYLNVWTSACDDARRPVMVWLHGGSYIFGSGSTSWYDGTRFVHNGDVVVVTINYRLGPFGFLHLADHFGDDVAGSGNAGILDQIAALEWVRDCITGFGGDPDDVTVFGESAGANSVGTLLGLPAARGLFGKAIAQSGAGAWVSTRERAAMIAQQVIDRLGVHAGDLDALQAVSKEQLLAAAPDLSGEVREALPWQPVLDDSVLHQMPHDAIAGGSAAGVHVLTGTNQHEWTMFQIVDPSIAELDDLGIVHRLRGWADDPAEVLRTYRAVSPDASPQEIWMRIATDVAFRMPATRLAEAQLAHGPVWMYRFTWETPFLDGALRSTHAIELPFVFDNLDRPGVDVVTGDGPERQAVADGLHRAWIAFARSGDPGWPRYDTSRRPTMRFDRHLEVLDDPDPATRRAWDTAAR